jgi:sporulation protein YlmC with PRC-barrel domain
MSKPQKEKSLTKDRLIGMKVINGEGKLLGTVKDLGFTVGKAGISLSVEDSNGETQEIDWDNIQGAVDFVVLKSVPQISASNSEAMPQTQPSQPVQYAQPAQVAQPAQAAPSAPLCPICRGPLTWIPQYKRWYCYKDQKYA